MLTIRDQEHFNKVVRHAVSVGTLEGLLGRLEYLSEYSEDTVDCVIAEDRCSEWGFDFAMYRTLNGERDASPWFIGGLIEHDESEWSVHT